MVYIVADYSEWEREIDRIGSMPSAGMTATLDALLEETFMATQAAVHVETGSLKSSGKVAPGVEGGTSWHGEFAYGGVSAGVHNPVVYAVYERARGGAHDFLMNATLSKSQWIEGMLKELGNHVH